MKIKTQLIVLLSVILLCCAQVYALDQSNVHAIAQRHVNGCLHLPSCGRTLAIGKVTAQQAEQSAYNRMERVKSEMIQLRIAQTNSQATIDRAPAAMQALQVQEIAAANAEHAAESHYDKLLVRNSKQSQPLPILRAARHEYETAKLERRVILKRMSSIRQKLRAAKSTLLAAQKKSKKEQNKLALYNGDYQRNLLSARSYDEAIKVYEKTTGKSYNLAAESKSSLVQVADHHGERLKFKLEYLRRKEASLRHKAVLAKQSSNQRQAAIKAKKIAYQKQLELIRKQAAIAKRKATVQRQLAIKREAAAKRRRLAMQEQKEIAMNKTIIKNNEAAIRQYRTDIRKYQSIIEKYKKS